MLRLLLIDIPLLFVCLLMNVERERKRKKDYIRELIIIEAANNNRGCVYGSFILTVGIGCGPEETAAFRQHFG